MTGAADSDELIAAGYSWSLPHPPGFPLLMVLIRGVTLIFSGNPTWAAHLLSGWVMAAAVTVVFLSVVSMFGLNRKKRSAVWEWGLLAVAGFGVGISGLVWEHGVHMEVFGLLGLFALVLLWIGIEISKKLQSKKRVAKRWWAALAVVMGLGLSHHQLFVLSLVPVLGFLGWRMLVLFKWSWKIATLVVLGALVVFVGVYVGLIWWIAAAGSPDSWRLGQGLQGLWDFYMRRDFSGVLMDGETLSAWFSRVEVRGVAASLSYYVSRWWHDWSVFGLFGLLGIVFGKQLLKDYWWLLLAGFIFSGPVLAGYLAVPSGLPGTVTYEMGAAVLERMYVLGALWWGAWVLIGVFIGIQLGLRLIRNERAWFLILGVSVVGMGVLVWWLWPMRSLATYQAPLEYVEAVMADLPDKSRLICLSDLSCFGTYYYQTVLGKRPDVVVVPAPVQHRLGRVNMARDLVRFWYLDNPYRLGEVLGYSTLKDKPVYVTQLSESWMQTLGFGNDVFWLVPDGYRFLVLREAAVPVRQPVRIKQTELWAKQQMPDYGFVRAFKAVVVEQHVLQSAIWKSYGAYQTAAAELEAAWTLWPENAYVLEAAAFISEISVVPERFEVRDSRFYWDQARACRDRDVDGCDVLWARWLVWRYPTDAAARSWLARSLELAHQLPLAKREYARSLELDPTYAEAKIGLARLEQVADLGEYFY
jgi:hypothetical protein